MQKVLTAEQMREVDRLTTERYGMPSILLMENAAQAAARVIVREVGGCVTGRSIVIFCGKGNNGGDGAALARVLSTMGAHVDVILLGSIAETSGDARTNFDILANIAAAGKDRSNAGGYADDSAGRLSFHVCPDAETWQGDVIGEIRGRADVVVDAILGTGVTRELEGLYLAAAQSLAGLREDRSNNKPLVVALDLPSGVSSDLGYPIGVSAKADVTVTFTAPKPANVLPGVASYGGHLVVADIGSPAQLIDDVDSRLELVQARDLERWFRKSRFSDDSYKNKRGHALLIAGSADYKGAAVLCGNAAIRSGAGLVTLAVPASSKGEIASRVLPEVILKGIADNESGEISENAFGENSELLRSVDAVAVGCGLSANDAGVEKLVSAIVETRQTPVIVDAGALWFFSPFNVPVKHTDNPLILTPHEGEFMRLLGTDDKTVIADRVAAVRKFATGNNVILVLKGERVLIGEPGGRVVINPTGNAGLGKAGNGDTLAGILTGFVAQAVKLEIDIFDTVVAAVYVAGMAGDIAEKKYGKRVMTASDVRECLVEVFAGLGMMIGSGDVEDRGVPGA